MAVVCPVCSLEVQTDGALCVNGCKLHFGSCAGIVETSWRKQADRSNWKCCVCRKAKENKTEKNGKSSEKPVTSEELRSFMLSIDAKLKPIQQLESINETVNELKVSMEFMSEKYDEMLKKSEDQEKLVRCLQNKVEVNEKTINNLKARIRESEQYARNRNIEISGLEEVEGEDLMKIMGNIAEKIDVALDVEYDIDVIHRVKSRNKKQPPKVIVQFSMRKTRDLWLQSKKGFEIKSCEVTNGSAATKVYLNNHLTQEWKELIWKAKQYGRPKGYMMVWFSGGKIYTKKDKADKNLIIIENEEDFTKML